MRYLLFLFLFPVALFSQVPPNTFERDSTITGSEHIYTQDGGTPRRIHFVDARKRYFGLQDSAHIAVTPTAANNTRGLNSIFTDANNDVWIVTADSSGFNITDSVGLNVGAGTSRSWAEFYTTGTMANVTTSGTQHFQGSSWQMAGVDFTRTDSVLTYTGSTAKYFAVNCNFSSNSDVANRDVTYLLVDDGTNVTRSGMLQSFVTANKNETTAISGVLYFTNGETFRLRYTPSATGFNFVTTDLHCIIEEIE